MREKRPGKSTDTATALTFSEREQIPIECPYCATEVADPSAGDRQSCWRCRRLIDVEAQYTFIRGLDLFLDACEVEETLTRGMDPELFRRRSNDVRRAYQQAYSALQIAFASRLSERQRAQGIEIMAVVSRELSMRTMASSLESGYWGRVLTELNAQKELQELRRLLEQASSLSPLHLLRRVHWNMRRRQLERSLAKLSQQIDAMEKMIEFVEPPQARQPLAEA